MNTTPSGERVHIGIFGKRNAGKSSLLNAIAGQESAIVSETAGTTTDPVKRVMELLPLGPVVLIDTPGLDDEGELGAMRVARARNMLHVVDIAVVVTAGNALDDVERGLLRDLADRHIPCVLVANKTDIMGDADRLQRLAKEAEAFHAVCHGVSASEKTGIHELRELLARLIPEALADKPLIRDMLQAGDTVILVVPIDSAAPKGRLILPQQMTLREVLDVHGAAVVVQTEELQAALESQAKPPALVVTDSQAFGSVMKIVPEAVPLTSFSILMARKKGNLHQLVEGAEALDTLADGDRILIAEGCTHHRQCDDIGSVKLPAWIKQYAGKELEFAFCSGNEFPETLSSYKLIVHCGGCMLNDKELQHRQQCAALAGIPMTNYGTAIAKIHGILARSLTPFEKEDAYGKN